MPRQAADGRLVLTDEEQSSTSTNARRSRRDRRTDGGNASAAARQPKLRTGPPPQAPKFNGDKKSDPRCWEHWRDEVEAWRFRVVHYLPLPEAALLLREAISADAYKEIADVPPMSWATEDGVTRLVETMRLPFREDARSRKSELLANYERFRRAPNEKMQTYVTRYVRVERALKEVGVNYATILDPETRGLRLLEKALLGEDHYRLIVVEAVSLEFDDIVRAVQVLYPERVSAPPLVWPTKERETHKDQDHRQQARPNHSTLSSRASSSGSSSASRFTRSALVTEEVPTEAGGDALQTIPERGRSRGIV